MSPWLNGLQQVSPQLNGSDEMAATKSHVPLQSTCIVDLRQPQSPRLTAEHKASVHNMSQGLANMCHVILHPPQQYMCISKYVWRCQIKSRSNEEFSTDHILVEEVEHHVS